MAWRHFNLAEFECKCGCGHNQISHELVDLLDAGREELGFPFVISSGYRCPDHNQRVSSTGLDGPHTTGKSSDVLIMGMNAFMLLQWAMRSGQFYGIGIKQKGPHAKRFIHLDRVDNQEAFRPTVWTY